jgi:hypothetical protein
MRKKTPSNVEWYDVGGSELAIVGLHVRFTYFSIPYATS